MGESIGFIHDIKNGLLDEVELLECVTSDDLEVAIMAASSRWATEPIIDIAAHDLDRDVRMAALGNPNIGRKTILLLTEDKDRNIAMLAKEKLGEKMT